jgi:AcrR family transcriptional regulator
MTRRGDDARTALVDQAERLFAERGIEAVSLRDVSAAAGQRNHSAAQYHFGDRAGLVAAVYEARMQFVNERRYRCLREIDRAGRGDDVTALVAAVVVPLVEVVAETNGWYGRFLARSRWDSFGAEVVAALPAVSSFRVTVERLHHTLRHLPAAIRHSRTEQLLTLVVGTIAGWEWAHHRGERRLPVAVLTGELIATGVAVLTAPVAMPSNVPADARS